MQSRNISHQIIKSVSCHFSCTIQIDSIESFHNFCVIWNFKIRNNRLTKALQFHIFTVIFSNRNRWINDIRNYHHIFEKFFLYLFLSCGKFFNTGSGSSYLFLYFFSFFFLSLCHQCTDLFGNFISLCTKSFYFLFDFAILFVQFQNFIH